MREIPSHFGLLLNPHMEHRPPHSGRNFVTHHVPPNPRHLVSPEFFHQYLPERNFNDKQGV